MRHRQVHVVVRSDDSGESFVWGVFTSEEEVERAVDWATENDLDGSEYTVVSRLLDTWPQG